LQEFGLEEKCEWSFVWTFLVKINKSTIKRDSDFILSFNSNDFYQYVMSNALWLQIKLQITVLSILFSSSNGLLFVANLIVGSPILLPHSLS
jgi:hypothetical protein